MTSPTTAEVLEAAADLLAKPGAWTQGTWARDAQGNPDPAPGEDVCWCLYGAIRRASGFKARLSDDAFFAVKPGRYFDAIEFNDAPGRTQAEVVEALRAAALQADGGGE